ncbi:glycerate kinase [Enterococcus faecium]|nr:glycerate kinase [Enterococcus faecium]
MKILTAIDSFKGSFTSDEANNIIKEVFTDDKTTVETIAIADGGEGTLAAFTQNLQGEILEETVCNLVGHPVQGKIGWLAEKQTAIIEVAEAVGIGFLSNEDTTPWDTNSYGIGEMIRLALDKGAKTILIGLGGTGTIDGGIGLAGCLGVIFFDSDGKELSPYPKNFEKIASFDTNRVDKRLFGTDIILLADVTSRLLGNSGAVYLFGEQKGLSREEMPIYEKALAHFAGKIAPNQNFVEGDGAAGGIGFMLRKVFQGKFVKGFDYLAQQLDLKMKIAAVDLVITGEGRLDEQSLKGKVPIGIAKMAQQAGVPCIVFTGQSQVPKEKYIPVGISAVVPIVDAVMTLEEAICTGKTNLARVAQRTKLLLDLSLDDSRKETVV